MTTLPFTNKQEYLTWRSRWRTDYAALTERIRELKVDRHENNYPCQSNPYASMCYRCRLKARQMLEERKQSKIQAQEQYQAAKANEKATPIGS